MYGNYPLIVDIAEVAGELAQVLTQLKGRQHDVEELITTCAHYKQMALVSACAFMMSPIGGIVKGNLNHPSVRAALHKEISNIFNRFVDDQVLTHLRQSSRLAGLELGQSSDEAAVVVTELAHYLISTLLVFQPELKKAVALPNLYMFIPTDVHDTAVKNVFSFMVRVVPHPNVRLLT